MKFLGLTQDAKDFASTEYVNQVVETEGGKIDTISVDNIPQEIINKNVNINISGKADKTAVPEKELLSANGIAKLFNEQDGGGAQFVGNNGITSFVGVNDATGSDNGRYVAAYVQDPNGKTVRLGLTKNGAYYTIDKKNFDVVDEIATIRDIRAAMQYSIKKKETAEEGYLATYYLVDATGAQQGYSINIPKDFLLKSGQVKDCIEDNVPIEGFRKGDKYIDLEINTKEGGDTASHLYINVSDLVDNYIAGDNIDIDNNVISAIDTTYDIATTEDAGLMSSEAVIKLATIESNAEVNKIESVNSELFEIDDSKQLNSTKLQGISEEANKVENSTVNGNILIDGVETTIYELPEISYNDLIDKPTIPTNVSAFTNDAGYLTEHQSLSAYRTASDQNVIDAGKQATITDLTNIREGAALGKTSIQSLEGYATEDWVEGKGYLTEHQSLAAYRASADQDVIDAGKQATINDLADIRSGAALGATALQEVPSTYRTAAAQDVIDASKASKSEIPIIPTNISAFTNDAGYLTEHQSLTGYATESWVEGKNYLTEHQDISGKSDITYVDSEITRVEAEIPNKTSDLTNDSGFIDNSYHDATKQDRIADLSTIKSGAALGATAVQPNAIADMATKTWVGNQGYLTEHQDISDKANQADLVSHTTDTNIHVTAEKKAEWDAKATVDMIPVDLSDLIGAPTTDGTYVLKCVVSGEVPNYSWVIAE